MLWLPGTGLLPRSKAHMADGVREKQQSIHKRVGCSSMAWAFFFLAQWFCLWAYLESLVSAAGCLPSPTEWALPVSAGPSRRLYLLDFASSIWILSFSKLPKVPIYLQLPGIMLMHLISQMHSLFCSNVSAKQENITNSNSYKLLNCVPHSAPALWHEIPQTGCSQC